jgi:hypothetical protein
MAASKAPKLNNKKRRPKTTFKSNNVEPSPTKEYEIAWKLEYDRLSDVEKRVIDNAKVESIHGLYTRHYFVDAFVKRVIELVEPVPNEPKQQKS